MSGRWLPDTASHEAVLVACIPPQAVFPECARGTAAPGGGCEHSPGHQTLCMHTPAPITMGTQPWHHAPGMYIPWHSTP